MVYRFTRCRHQAPTGRHANPTLAGGSDDEAAGTDRCRQERLRAGAETKDIRVMTSTLALYNIDRNKTGETDEARWMTGAP